MVAHDAEIDLEEVKRCSQQEGTGEELERIKTFCWHNELKDMVRVENGFF